MVSDLSDEILISGKDAAAILGISLRTLERYVSEGQVPYVRLPQRGERAPLRFSRTQLKRWVERHTVKPSQTSRNRGENHGREVRQDEVSRRVPA